MKREKNGKTDTCVKVITLEFLFSLLFLVILINVYSQYCT